MTTIYVAGASAEVGRIAGYIDRLKRAGHEITHDWTISVLGARAQRLTDDRLSGAVRADYADEDLIGITLCDTFWLVVPEAPSTGCWVELGAALCAAHQRTIVVSGDWKRSIFTSLADYRFDTHEEVFDWLGEAT